MALLGIDLGTTGVKALLIDEGGDVLASATVEYPLLTPQPLWSEQHPEDWWHGTTDAIRAVLSKAGIAGADVRGIGLSGQMHGMTLLDRDGGVIRPAILWNDQRTAAQCAEIVERAGGVARVRELIANVPPPSYTSPKLLWVRENEPHAWERIATLLLPKDYIRYRLSGERATEVSDATGTGLLDVRARTWSDECCVCSIFRAHGCRRCMNRMWSRPRSAPPPPRQQAWPPARPSSAAAVIRPPPASASARCATASFPSRWARRV